MIKSLFTNNDYNKRFLKILKIKKLRDVKNGSQYIGKKVRIYKNQNNFLTFENYYTILHPEDYPKLIERSVFEV